MRSRALVFGLAAAVSLATSALMAQAPRPQAASPLASPEIVKPVSPQVLGVTVALPQVLAMTNSRNGTSIVVGPNMTPGTVRSGTVTIKNTGALRGSYRLSLASLTNTPSSSPLMSAILRLRVVDASLGVTLYDGAFGALPSTALCGTGKSRPKKEPCPDWDKDEQHDFTFVVTFPSTAGNAYQGRRTSATFSWDATAP